MCGTFSVWKINKCFFLECHKTWWKYFTINSICIKYTKLWNIDISFRHSNILLERKYRYSSFKSLNDATHSIFKEAEKRSNSSTFSFFFLEGYCNLQNIVVAFSFALHLHLRLLNNWIFDHLSRFNKHFEFFLYGASWFNGSIIIRSVQVTVRFALTPFSLRLHFTWQLTHCSTVNCHVNGVSANRTYANSEILTSQLTSDIDLIYTTFIKDVRFFSSFFLVRVGSSHVRVFPMLYNITVTIFPKVDPSLKTDVFYERCLIAFI